MYTGILDPKKMNKVEKSGYTRWLCQRERCNRKKHKDYKTYGARGIKVEYSSREFMSWWLHNINKYQGDYDKVHVGRIDHSKNYTLDNIELISNSENVIERNERVGYNIPKKPVYIIDAKSGEKLILCSSSGEAAELASVNPITITRHCRDNIGNLGNPLRQPYTFEWV